MAGSNEVKVRYRILISGELDGEKFRKELKKEANQCGVTGIARLSSDNQLEIILEGEKGAASKVFAWLMKKPRLPKIARLESDTETFLNEFKDFQIA